MASRRGPEDPPDDESPLFAVARRLDPDTSHAAAASLSDEALNHPEALILAHLRAAPERGGTTTEIADAHGLDRDSISPRMPRLVNIGIVFDSGERRRTPKNRMAIVWKARL